MTPHPHGRQEQPLLAAVTVFITPPLSLPP